MLNEEENEHALGKLKTKEIPTMKATQRKVQAAEIMRGETRTRVSVVENVEKKTREKKLSSIRYDFLRIPFGIKSPQEVFQKRVSHLFENLKGAEIDILVWETTRKEHYDTLRSVLNTCQEVGLTLNAEKCKFRVKEVTYIGHTLSTIRKNTGYQRNAGSNR
ncbi:unnamed protein product [Mytilus coruscus]|uniref:Reverse transcriptase domain-containing protein n=1 Tax=Mytilus coruscus TaxID=42192 RepID=A0A6J8AZP4_MYTCO|nr:unnamed protein product [Mytilus coruscus]